MRELPGTPASISNSVLLLQFKEMYEEAIETEKINQRGRSASSVQQDEILDARPLQHTSYRAMKQ